MTVKNRGGRPPISKDEMQKYPIALRISQKEYLTLKANSKMAGITKSECIRQAIMGSVVQSKITPEIADFIRKLCGMANNLNQIARRANSAGYRDVRSEYLNLAERIDNLLTELEK